LLEIIRRDLIALGNLVSVILVLQLNTKITHVFSAVTVFTFVLSIIV